MSAKIKIDDQRRETLPHWATRSADCMNLVSLCNPREALPPLLRECLMALDTERVGKLSLAFRKKLLPHDGSDESAQRWRNTVWWAAHHRESVSIEDTYVQFFSVDGPPGAAIDDLARIFGRSLRLLYINDMLGVCGYAISRPDGRVESRSYPLWNAPRWLIAEMGMPDCVWSDKWQMHIPAKAAAFPSWSDSQGWIDPCTCTHEANANGACEENKKAQTDDAENFSKNTLIVPEKTGEEIV